jgi:hypothetical protein
MKELRDHLPEGFPKSYIGVREFVKRHWSDLKPIKWGTGRGTRYMIPVSNVNKFIKKFNK